MKLSSYPPFVVFFDTIAVFLFVLIVNQSSGFEFILPDDSNGESLFKGARIIYEKDDEYWFSDSLEKLDFDNFDIKAIVSCEKQSACADVAYKNPKSKIYVLIPDDLHSDGGKFSLVVSKLGCPGLKLQINNKGQIDRELTYLSNSCLKSIPGIERWVTAKPRAPSS